MLKLLLNTLVSFVAKKARAQRFIIDARASYRHFFSPFCGSLLTQEGLCHVEFQGALDYAQHNLKGSADIENAFHQMRIPGWLRAFFALPAVLASEVCSGSTINQKRLAPDSLIYTVPTTLLMVFSLAMFFCQDVTDHCTLAGMSLLFVLAVTPLHTTAQQQTRHGVPWFPLVVQ